MEAFLHGNSSQISPRGEFKSSWWRRHDSLISMILSHPHINQDSVMGRAVDWLPLLMPHPEPKRHLPAAEKPNAQVTLSAAAGTRCSLSRTVRFKCLLNLNNWSECASHFPAFERGSAPQTPTSGSVESLQVQKACCQWPDETRITDKCWSFYFFFFLNQTNAMKGSNWQAVATMHNNERETLKPECCRVNWRALCVLEELSCTKK